MNREIIFRGKRIDNEEWVEIEIFKGRKGFEEWTDGLGPVTSFVDTSTGNSKKWCRANVNPETVSQYTERKDKTGIRIFEGDIVKIGSFIYQVEFRYSEWEFRILSKKVYCFPNFDSHTGECEIIGNRFDNPELLVSE